MLPDKDQTRESPKEVTDGEEQRKNEHILALLKRLETSKDSRKRESDLLHPAMPTPPVHAPHGFAQSEREIERDNEGRSVVFAGRAWTKPKRGKRGTKTWNPPT